MKTKKESIEGNFDHYFMVGADKTDDGIKMKAKIEGEGLILAIVIAEVLKGNPPLDTMVAEYLLEKD